MSAPTWYERNKEAEKLEQRAAKAGLQIRVARKRSSYWEGGRQRHGVGPVVELDAEGRQIDELGDSFQVATSTVLRRAQRARRAA